MKIVCHSKLGLTRLIDILEDRGYSPEEHYSRDTPTIWHVKIVVVKKPENAFRVENWRFKDIPKNALRAGDVIYKYNNPKTKEGKCGT